MSLTKQIEEMFNNPEKVSEESVNSLVQEAVRLLNDMKERLGSEDEKVRSQALEDAAKVQLQLKGQMEKIRRSLGVSLKQTENDSKATDVREDVFGQALQKLQKNLKDQVKQRKPKRVKEWLAS